MSRESLEPMYTLLYPLSYDAMGSPEPLSRFGRTMRSSHESMKRSTGFVIYH